MRIILIGSLLLFASVAFPQNTAKNSEDREKMIQKAESVRQNGHSFYNKKKYDSALIRYVEALTLFKLESDSVGIAKCYNNIGNSNLFLGNDSLAVTAFYKAIEINKKIVNSKYLISNYINLASYYGRQQEFDLSLKYFLEAKDQVDNSNYELKLPIIYLGLGNLLSEKGYQGHDYKLSQDYYQKALKYYVIEKDSIRVSSLYNNLGVLLSLQLKFDSSLYYYSKSIEYKDALGDHRGQITAFLNIGKVYLEQGNYGLALDYFSRGAELALQFDDKVNYYHIISNILQCKIKLGELEQADSLFAIYNSLNDSIYNQEKAKNLKELEVLYETQKIGNDLKDQIKQTEAKTRLSYWYLALMLGVSLLFIITVLFFIQNKKYQQTLKTQELERLKKAQEIKELNAMMQGQEDERNRIAEDLHDRLGARLSAIKLLALSNGQKSSALSEMLEAAIKETREISHNLSTDMLTKFGLPNAITDFIRTVNESNQIEGDFTTTNLEERLPKQYEKTIFHIVLELVNNTIRHANASSFFIQLTRYKNEIDLIYEDDGDGFDAKQSTFEGMGMSNLAARVDSINGKINIDSMPGKGIQVVMSASLESSEAVPA